MFIYYLRIKQIQKKKGFTLIELLVVITIVGILATVGYAPYTHYAKRAQVSLALEYSKQAFHEAHGFATAGYSHLNNSLDKNKNKNSDIGLIFKPGENYLYFISYPYDLCEHHKKESGMKTTKILKCLQDPKNPNLNLAVLPSENSSSDIFQIKKFILPENITIGGYQKKGTSHPINNAALMIFFDSPHAEDVFFLLGNEDVSSLTKGKLGSFNVTSSDQQEYDIFFRYKDLDITNLDNENNPLIKSLLFTISGPSEK